MDKAEKAKQILRHYFQLVAEKSGIHWNSDNDSEVEWIVDLIILAAVEKTRDSLAAA